MSRSRPPSSRSSPPKPPSTSAPGPPIRRSAPACPPSVSSPDPPSASASVEAEERAQRDRVGQVRRVDEHAEVARPAGQRAPHEARPDPRAAAPGEQRFARDLPGRESPARRETPAAGSARPGQPRQRACTRRPARRAGSAARTRGLTRARPGPGSRARARAAAARIATRLSESRRPRAARAGSLAPRAPAPFWFRWTPSGSRTAHALSVDLHPAAVLVAGREQLDHVEQPHPVGAASGLAQRVVDGERRFYEPPFVVGAGSVSQYTRRPSAV